MAAPAVPFRCRKPERTYAMNVTETIRTFREFFGERGHEVVPGSSLVAPDGDPVLFTTAGMHPLTRYLEGHPHPQGRRLAGVQRCLRTTDLDEVGDDRHLTVFQMLGSWSLGDYDGPQSLRWAGSYSPTASASAGIGCMPRCSAAMTRWAPTCRRGRPGASSA